MSELAKTARAAMKRKAYRMAGADPGEKVDASDWSPSEPMNTGSTVGMKPVSPRQYKRGGHVMAMDGEHEHRRADRKRRKSGGRLADELMNRDQKEANRERPGGDDHVGGYKKGGAPKHKDMGGPLASPISSGIGGQGRMGFNYPQAHSPIQGLKHGGHADEKEDRQLVKRMVKKPALTGKKHGGETNAAMNGMRPEGGRVARATGGHAGRGNAHWIKDAVGHKGALHRELHVPEGEKISQHKLHKAEHSSNKLVAKRAHLAETLEHLGGRGHKASGGRAKGKTNINIVIAPGHDGGQPMAGGMPPPPGAGMPPPRPPQGVPIAMPPQGGQGMPMPMPYPMPVGGAPPMGAGMPPGMLPRRKGGRVAEDMAEHGGGAGGGLGRLEKIRAYGHEA